MNRGRMALLLVVAGIAIAFFVYWSVAYVF